MDVFGFDPAKYREEFVVRGWVHVPGGADEGFLELLREECLSSAKASPGHLEKDALHGTGIRGAKNQYLYEPPSGVDLRSELQRLATGMCGLDGRGFAVSERHIKWYDADAEPEPSAHKDRLSSQISIGIAIEVPAGSTLVLYPSTDVGVNPFLTADLKDSLAAREQPDVILRDAPFVEIEDRPGDVVIFPGSAWWHRRRRSAGTINLYLKCNDFDCDPLGEDPLSVVRALQTVEQLDLGDADLLGAVVPVPARRLEWVGVLRGRDGVDRAFAKLWDRAPVRLNSTEHALLQALDTRLPWREIAADYEADLLAADLLRLASLGFVDLVPEPQ
jgi:hypothetical protein